MIYTGSVNLEVMPWYHVLYCFRDMSCNVSVNPEITSTCGFMFCTVSGIVYTVSVNPEVMA